MSRVSLLGTEFEVLRTLDSQLLLRLALLAFQTQDNLTCGLCLLVKDRFCLSPKTHLFGVVSTLSLCEVGSLSCLVLCHFVKTMLIALPSLAEGSAFFRDIHHDGAA